jgi:hypothetical protein
MYATTLCGKFCHHKMDIKVSCSDNGQASNSPITANTHSPTRGGAAEKGGALPNVCPAHIQCT